MTLLLPPFVGAPTVNTVYHVDALTLLRALPDSSVDLIATDPPFNIDKASWDSWATLPDFLAWLDEHLREMKRVLKPNGSLYLFAATRYQAHVEITVGKHFNVLSNIRWRKPAFSTKAEMFDKESMRGFFPASESIVFAEQYGSDESDDGVIGYTSQIEAVKVSVFGAYLSAEFDRAGVTRKAVAALFPSRTGGLTGCVSNWVLGLNMPTPEQYQAMRDYLNRQGGEHLKRDYEDLRNEYEYLRREYEDLRRPFYASADAPYTDVWDFKTVNTYPGKHICEKPLDMCQHIIRISSRPGALVLDPFCGSGNLLRAAFVEGRQFIGGDMDLRWATKARESITLPFAVPLFDMASAS